MKIKPITPEEVSKMTYNSQPPKTPPAPLPCPDLKPGEIAAMISESQLAAAWDKILAKKVAVTFGESSSSERFRLLCHELGLCK